MSDSKSEEEKNSGDDDKLEMTRKVKRIKRLEDDKSKPTEEPHQLKNNTPLLHLNDDCFLVLYLQLTLLDGLHLGSTCRRLYNLYRNSFKDRQSLALYKYSFSDCFKMEDIYSFGVRKSSPAHLQMREYVPTISQFIDLFPNLINLEIIHIESCRLTIAYLVTVLNHSVVGSKLQSLKLEINSHEGCHFSCKSRKVAPVTIEELHLPSLKHLSLTFRNEGNSVQLVLNSLLLHSVFPQLTSFHISADRRLWDVFDFVSEHVFANPQLAVAAGTAALQVTFNTVETQFNFEHLEEPDYQTFQCITSISISDLHSRFSPGTMLPLLTNLRKVAIQLSGENQNYVSKSSYLDLLNNLATLQYLEEIIVDAISHKDFNKGRRFARHQMPVLPSVRTFSLEYCNHYHDDPVELFHLAHCFPGLKQISVEFVQFVCEYCVYTKDTSSVFQECGLNLARGLLRCGTGNGWHSQVKVKEVVVSFPFEKVNFSSLDCLVAGIIDD